jgi:uncharacterized protein (DUF433 family)
MTDQPRITLDPDVLAGKPVVRGTRLSVEFIIGLMADGWSETDILRNYPTLAHEDISACLGYAFFRDLIRPRKNARFGRALTLHVCPTACRRRTGRRRVRSYR